MDVLLSVDEAERLLLDYLERCSISGADIALDEVCQGRPELAPLVHDLLQRHAETVAALAAFRGANALAQYVAANETLDGAVAPFGPATGTRYELVREVGHGGMGIVLEVRDAKLRRTLAMKLVREAPPSGTPALDGLRAARRRARLLEEAQVLAQLDHPGVPPVHDMGEDDHGRAYFTMPLVRGSDLGVVLAGRRDGGAAPGKLAELDHGAALPRLVEVLLRVAETVAHAHSRGVVHRDLKPQNIMLDAHGVVLVLDWGLARVSGSCGPDARIAAPVATDRSNGSDAMLLTLEGDAIGTPAYMSPEQARGDLARVDARTDVYALGAILYEVLAGAAPYSECGGGAQGVLQAVRTGPPRKLAASAADAPPELVAIAERAMSREADERYGSLEDFATDLRAYLEGRVVRAHRTGAWIELRKWILRNRATAAAIWIAAAAGAALLVQQALTSRERGRLNDALQSELYRSKIAIAQRAFDQDDIFTAQEALRDCPAELRGWEWDHLARLVDTSDRVFLEHGGASVHSVAWSPDGSMIVSGDVTARVLAHFAHEARNTQVVSESATTMSRCEKLEFSPSGVELLQNWPLRRSCWRPHTTVHLSRIGGQSETYQDATWIDDGRYAVLDRDKLRIFESATDTELFARGLPTNESRKAVTSRDGRRLVIGDLYGGLRVYSTADVTLLGEVQTHVGALVSAAISADGRWAAVTGQVHELRVVDLDAHVVTARLPRAQSSFSSIAISPDGRCIVGASGSIADVWRGQGSEWTRVARLVGHTGPIHALAFDPQGRWVASAGDDGAVRLWDLSKSGRDVEGIRLGANGDVAWSPDGAWLAVANRTATGGIHLLDGRTAEQLSVLPVEGGVYGIDWSRDGVLAGSATEGVILFWRPPEPSPFATLDVSTYQFPSHFLDFAPDGRVLTARTDGRVAAFEWATGRVVWMSNLKRGLSALEYSPDGRWLAWASSEGVRGNAGLITPSTGAVLLEFADEPSHLRGLSWSADSRWLTVGGSSSTLVTFGTREQAVAWRSVAAGRSIAPQHAPQGERLFSGTADGALDVRDARDGVLLASFRRHATQVLDCAISPDGTRVATLDNAGVLWIHDRRAWPR